MFSLHFDDVAALYVKMSFPVDKSENASENESKHENIL
ncbi:hypothetical protein Bhyg_00570 [Pseudolycoriella hygida]|uniref:Uncharacterized protein n=1 Tax=Pseudolycoriella hygida TaxID=35572 RepID=A0A9Q0N9W8_9DIPT|nr:hypothetical protein Bhyg_00570 [Pseudolycoriella hygida]